MENSILNLFSNHCDPLHSHKIYTYFEDIKQSSNGWRYCISFLLTSKPENDERNIFSLQVLEYHIKKKYILLQNEDKEIIKNFLFQYVYNLCSYELKQELFLTNKLAHLFSLVFSKDYLSNWPSFFNKLNGLVTLGAYAVDIYLRILIAIDSEVINREIIHSKEETENIAQIKDKMRVECIPELVDTWYFILVTYEDLELTKKCFMVVGTYISWIDIHLIANNKFVSILLKHIKNVALRVNVAECIGEIVSKGMDPFCKYELVESFVSVLEPEGILCCNQNIDDDEEDFHFQIAKLMNIFACNLLQSYEKLSKFNESNANIVLEALQRKISLVLSFLQSDVDDACSAVFEFTREYLQLLKQKSFLSDMEMQHLKIILTGIIKKMQLDSVFNIDDNSDEAAFYDLRKQLKILFDNLSAVSKDWLQMNIKDYVFEVLNKWQTFPFNSVETALYLIYLLGEVIPGSLANQFGVDYHSILQELMEFLISSNVSFHPHPLVIQQFFETIVRYEKYFVIFPNHIPNILVAFLDQRGMRNFSMKVRSRTSYLFCKFVKGLRGQLHGYVKDVFPLLPELLLLNSSTSDDIFLLSQDDQLYLFEAAAVLIIEEFMDNSMMMFRTLLSPVFEKISILSCQLEQETNNNETSEVFKCLCHAVSVTSRTSKAFTNQYTMNSCDCVDIYLEALQIFLNILQFPYTPITLQSSIRQFLHRMVVCLQEDLLPYIPIIFQFLLKASDIHSILEFMPLLNQIIIKYKKHIVPLLSSTLQSFVQLFHVFISSPYESNDMQTKRERILLQRSYFLFISTIVNNNLLEVLESQNLTELEILLNSVVETATDCEDAITQKNCFGILKKIIEVWGCINGSSPFIAFVYKSIVPSCFLAPLKSSFDLWDPQMLHALGESASCIHMVYKKRGEEFSEFLKNEYFPSINVSMENINKFIEKLGCDHKTFCTFFKEFLRYSKSVK